MELLIGAIITLLTELVKKLSNKIGAEMTVSIIYIVAFLCSLGYVIGAGIANGDLQLGLGLINEAGNIFGLAVGVNEVLVKRVIKPSINKLKTK